MPINPIDRFRASEGPQGPCKPSASDPARRSEGPSSDHIEISDEAHSQLQVHEMVATVRAAAAALPEVRQERVQQAQQRVQQGYYERPEVRGSVVDALLRAFRGQ